MKRASRSRTFEDQVKKLTRIGIALSAERDLEKLLEMIVSEARAFTRADAGSLYIREGDRLQFTVSQNDTLARRFENRGEVAGKFRPFPLPIADTSMAGYTANHGVTLNIPDVYQIPQTQPFQHNPSFDQKNDYRTQSMLVVPMRDHQNRVIGVLQLINALNEQGETVPFGKVIEELVESLASQAAVAVTNAQLTQKLKTAYLDTIYRLAMAAEYKDADTAMHIRRMSRYSEALARKLGFDPDRVELLLYASPMHDVGKLGVPDAILTKPGPLTPAERLIIENHTTFGAKILEGSDSELLEVSRQIAWSHHEKWDGTGYPRRLKQEEIPIEGRIVAIADVFDALTSRRPYKPAFTLDTSREMILAGRGSQFEPRLVDAFVAAGEEFERIYNTYQDEPPPREVER
jgi:HD-GYP domain-containing protein (c-di-GMP phosphodiesterase class II)